MNKPERLDGSELTKQGLNLQAVVDLSELPPDINQQLAKLTPSFQHYKQLILLGHGGHLLWQKVNDSGMHEDNPIDSYSHRVTREFFKQRLACEDFELVFPLANQAAIGLLALGEIVGWHHETPFRVGINDRWGSWFAYRAVVLTRSSYKPTSVAEFTRPCLECDEKPCIAACPAMPEGTGSLDILDCIDERKQAGTQCRDRCLARLACPVATEHRYCEEQLNYHYLRSWRTITGL